MHFLCCQKPKAMFSLSSTTNRFFRYRSCSWFRSIHKGLSLWSFMWLKKNPTHVKWCYYRVLPLLPCCVVCDTKTQSQYSDKVDLSFSRRPCSLWSQIWADCNFRDAVISDMMSGVTSRFRKGDQIKPFLLKHRRCLTAKVLGASLPVCYIKNHFYS